MPVAVNQPRAREEKDPLDTIMKGLQIAQGIYGIKEAGTKAELLKAQTEKQNALTDKQIAQLDRENSGVVTNRDLLAQAGKYVPAQAGDPSALKFRVQGDQGIQDIYLKPPKDESSAGLAGLIKQQQAALQGLQIQEHVKKAGEVEGPKAAAATYGRRMEEADRIMGELESQGYDRAGMTEGITSKLPGAVQGTHTKQQAQAERNFVNAVLRRESGAAISPAEFSSAEEQYFPRVGDSPEVKNQKAQNRAQAVAGLRAEAGHAWDKIPTAQASYTAQQRKAILSVPGLRNANAAPPKVFKTKDIDWAE